MGNIDRRYTLMQGRPTEVKAEIRDRIERVGRGGGYIISSADLITSYCKVENVVTMRDGVAQYSRYRDGS